MSQTAAHFRVGQRVVCIDASPNQRYGVAVPGLKRGGIYIIRSIGRKPKWESPGWGVLVEGICIKHPDVGCEWPMKPSRFRPVVDRPTDIGVFKKMLAGEPASTPPQKRKKPARPAQLELPL